MSSLVDIIELSMMYDINKISVSSHNVSNLSTPSFKREVVGRVSFDAYMMVDKYYNVPRVIINERQSTDKMIDFAYSTAKVTNNPLNLSIRSNGFFVLNTTQGEAYTRNGDFRIDTQGRLVTQEGYLVEGESGELRLTTTNPKILPDGSVWEGEERVGKLTIVEFGTDAITKMTRQKNGTYISKTNKPSIKDNPEILQGYIESSNVDTAFEMINTVETLRHFELNQKMLNMQQEMYKSSLESLGNF